MQSETAAEHILKAWPTATGRLARLNAGHINDTWTVGSRFVLQRLSRQVFPNPHAVMRNLAKALAHEGGRLLVAPIATADGEGYAEDDDGDVWRLFPLVPSRAFQALPDALLEPAGAAFGGFLTAFTDFPGMLEPVIPGFHDLHGYLAQLDAAVEATPPTDRRQIDAELRAVDALRETFAPSAARRVIHGDCKINNLLFHPTRDTVAAVIDLDTMMTGDPAWDFGDLVRSAFAGGEETSAAAPLSMPRFERLCRGFAGAFADIDDPERYAAAPAHMSFMLAVRFLADHLQGDAYFKVERRGANLLRARSQLELAARFLAARGSFAHSLAQAIG